MRQLSRAAMDAFFPRSKPSVTVGKTGEKGVSVGSDLYSHPVISNASGARIPDGSDVLSFEIDGQQVVIASGAFHTF